MPRISITRRKQWDEKQAEKNKVRKKIVKETVRKYCFTLRHIRGKIIMHTNDVRQVMEHLNFVQQPFFLYRIMYNGEIRNWPDEIYQINGDSQRILKFDKTLYDYNKVRDFMVEVAKTYRKPTMPEYKYVVLDNKVKKIEYATNDKLDLAMFLTGKKCGKFRLFIDHYYYPFPRQELIDSMKLMAILDTVANSKDTWHRMNLKRYTKWHEDINKAMIKYTKDSDVVNETRHYVPSLDVKKRKYYDGSPFEHLLEHTPTLQTYGEEVDAKMTRQQLIEQKELRKELTTEEFDKTPKYKKKKR
jgi:hypothetical protein